MPADGAVMGLDSDSCTSFLGVCCCVLELGELRKQVLSILVAHAEPKSGEVHIIVKAERFPEPILKAVVNFCVFHFLIVLTT